MKKKLSQILITALSLLLSVTTAFASSDAAPDSLHPTGCIVPTWEEILSSDEIDFNAFSIPRLGDINEDGSITAADARICLKIAADLADIGNYSDAAADINYDGKVTLFDARAILRAAARLEKLPDMRISTANLIDGRGVIIGPLKSKVCSKGWECTVSDETIKPELYTFNLSEPGIIGMPNVPYYVFTPSTPGEYTVTFNLVDYAKHSAVIDTFTLKLTVE